MRLRTPEPYTLTAEAGVKATVKVIEDRLAPGTYTPSMAFGADYVLALEGVILSRVAWAAVADRVWLSEWRGGALASFSSSTLATAASENTAVRQTTDVLSRQGSNVSRQMRHRLIFWVLESGICGARNRLSAACDRGEIRQSTFPGNGSPRCSGARGWLTRETLVPSRAAGLPRADISRIIFLSEGTALSL
jgi:hypothetical protein